jgi:ABC-2 type transport system permease protein
VENLLAKPEVSPGEIYDLGYRHYDGVRLGRAGAIRALYVEGVKTVFGIGRGGRAKIPPVLLIVLMIIPALVQAAFTGLVGNGLQLYRPETYFTGTVWLFGLFCAFQTPVLVTGDQQYRVLALYFSRALLRSDYVVARVAALTTSLFAVAVLPHFIMLLGRWFAAVAVWPAMKESFPLIPRILVTSFAIALMLAMISLTIAALIRRGPLGTGAILGYFLLASAFVTPLVFIRPEKMGQLLLASPMYVGQGFSAWVFDTTSNRAAADSALKESLKPPPPLPPTATQADTQAFRRRFRTRRRMTVLQVANLPGSEYLLCMMGYLVLAGGVLALRYRKIET